MEKLLLYFYQESKSEYQFEPLCKIVLEMMRQLIHENAHAAQDQNEYQQRYGAMVERYDKVKAKLDEVAQTIEHRNAKRVELERFIKILEMRSSLLTEFDNELWNAVIERLVVRSATEVIFTFRDGSELPWINR